MRGHQTGDVVVAHADSSARVRLGAPIGREAREARDQSRTASPLRPAQDALLLDNSQLTVEESVDQVLRWWQERQPFRTS